MELFISFILGATVAVGGFIVWGLYRLKKLDKTKDQLMEKLQKHAADLEAGLKGVNERLVKAKELTERQVSMMSQIDQPSKNALHSKYKNDLVYEIRKIEDEKNELLRSILKDGYDPSITILNPDNEKEVIKLS